jgi:arylsulfatase A-like enzyme
VDGDGPAINYKSAIRQGKWKLIYDLRNGHKELYNLSNDIGEYIDLSEQQPTKTKQLSILLKDILEKIMPQCQVIRLIQKRWKY